MTSPQEREGARGITVVSASAGSGKTYRLTEEVTRAVSANGNDRVPLDGLVAVTFTRKAHAELAARIRHSLVKSGAYEEAMRMPLAYLGTVHSACLRLVKEFALDAGLSPNVEVLSGSPSRLLREALEHALPTPARARLDALARKVELRIDTKSGNVDWVRDVASIMDLARSNRIRGADLAAMAERSFAGYAKTLPPAAPNGNALDEALTGEMACAVARLKVRHDGKSGTDDAILFLEEMQQKWRDDEVRWSDWTKLRAVKTAKPLMDCVAELGVAASAVERHPRLHADLRELTNAIFDAARVGLSAYQEWKAERRVVDYVDMLDRALDLVDDPRVSGELAERLKLVVVDELQDTSPIQLALFVRLHARAKRSIWVGDRKQCIFEYAGADPALMDDVTRWVTASGGARDRLEKSYRSRRELVELSNELFGAALERHGFDRADVAIMPVRGTVEGLPPVGVWWMDAGNDPNEAACLADGVRRLLEHPSETRVVDRVTGQPRPVRPGDIAVLVGTNRYAATVAEALHARGIRSAIARAGLLSMPEGTLLDAALRWVLDDRDALASATLDALTGWDPDAWLAARIASPSTPSDAAWRGALAGVRAASAARSPVETVDAVLAALDVVRMCARWPDAAQRIANVDALRALVLTYEARCAQDREAATIAGLLRAFDDLREKRMIGDELLASDDQHVPSDDGAVVVCTYHRSKGLEWPVVVLGQLNRQEKHDAFDVAPESDGGAFDPEAPLSGRWIRYWPWPFGATSAVPLRAAAAQSAEGVAVAAREDKERARLLYVGFTRARDHLVLAVRQVAGKEKKDWLDALCTASGDPLLVLPSDAADGAVATVRVGAAVVEARVMRPSSGVEAREEVAATPRWFVRAGVAVAREGYWLTPSSLSASSSSEVVVGEIERLGAGMVVEAPGYAYDQLGNAVHAFLAADVPGLSASVRLARAERLLGPLVAHVRAESLVGAADSLRVWVTRKWPGAVWRREVVVEGAIVEGGVERRVSGVIDLLLEVGDGLVVVDHKTFPGTTEASWRAKARDSATQLHAYARLLSNSRHRPATACWMNLPVGGVMLELNVVEHEGAIV